MSDGFWIGLIVSSAPTILGLSILVAGLLAMRSRERRRRSRMLNSETRITGMGASVWDRHSGE